ncbi:MAG: phosphoglucosamine mutase [Geminicoccaceae bacterium]|nr:phosphoglucosamine mutase [Geminicoccaceae bacterium]
MQRRFFGTDGIRGTANAWPMTAEVALALGRAAGETFRRGEHGDRVVIGKDTRLSGYMLEPALTAGFVSAGMGVMLVGPMPTPAVAFLTRSLRADLGVMVSASHNPFADNGIKLFGPEGLKLSDQVEAEIEDLMLRYLSGERRDGHARPEALGRARRVEDARGRYIENLKASFPKDLDLAGLKVVVDAANGAAYHIAPDLFFELGAEVVERGTEPDGLNINDGCGSTSPDGLAAAVREAGADIGIALDGDADRLILVDETGAVVDGDQVLALIARSWLRAGLLKGDGIAATLMSNFGLERFIETLGLALHRTQVGDRYVAERMRERGLNVGGEPSGHIILADFGTTGDGLMAALQVLAVMRRGGRPLSEVARCFDPLPQRLKNVRVARRIDLGAGRVKAALDAGHARLDGQGRLVVRPSGTEPLIRVMVEARDEATLGEVLETVAAAIEAEAKQAA